MRGVGGAAADPEDEEPATCRPNLDQHVEEPADGLTVDSPGDLRDLFEVARHEIHLHPRPIATTRAPSRSTRLASTMPTPSMMTFRRMAATAPAWGTANSSQSVRTTRQSAPARASSRSPTILTGRSMSPAVTRGSQARTSQRPRSSRRILTATEFLVDPVYRLYARPHTATVVQSTSRNTCSV